MMTLAAPAQGALLAGGGKIPPRARAIGIAIKDIQLPENCVIAAIIAVVRWSCHGV